MTAAAAKPFPVDPTLPTDLPQHDLDAARVGRFPARGAVAPTPVAPDSLYVANDAAPFVGIDVNPDDVDAAVAEDTPAPQHPQGATGTRAVEFMVPTFTPSKYKGRALTPAEPARGLHVYDLKRYAQQCAMTCADQMRGRVTDEQAAIRDAMASDILTAITRSEGRLREHLDDVDAAAAAYRTALHELSDRVAYLELPAYAKAWRWLRGLVARGAAR